MTRIQRDQRAVIEFESSTARPAQCDGMSNIDCRNTNAVLTLFGATLRTLTASTERLYANFDTDCAARMHGDGNVTSARA